MRTFMIASSALFLIGGIWSCDKIWSSSVTDCGRPGFKCPDGYTPPGQDLSMNGGDGGTSTGDMMGSAPDDMAGTAPLYTSVYVANDGNRTTMVGTGNGEIKIYYDNTITYVPGLEPQRTISVNPGKSITGIWRGHVYQSAPQDKQLIIAISNDNKIFSYIDGTARPAHTTPATTRSLWVGDWNHDLTTKITLPPQGQVKAYVSGDDGFVMSGNIQSDATVTWQAATNLGTDPRPSLRTLSGLASITTYELMMMCMMTTTGRCSEGHAWAAGDNGALFVLTGTGTWGPVGAFTPRPGAGSSYLGMAVDPYNTDVSVVGSSGTYVQRVSGSANSWTMPQPSPIGTSTLRSACAFSSYDRWAVGDGGVVYRTGYDILGITWEKDTIQLVDKNYATVDFKGVHCSPASNGKPQRVSVVGSKGTFIFRNYDSGMGQYMPWQVAAE